MRYKCLVLDHDDTVVDSSALIHYPPFKRFLEKYRPSQEINLEDYFLFNFDPGFSEYCYDVLKFSDEEMKLQTDNWLKYVSKHIPKAYVGMKELMDKFIAKGGIICVVSHSMKDNIIRDYKANDLPMPKLIYGWDLPIDERKPSAFPLEDIMKKLELNSSDLVVVDDLKPGKDMASKCGVDFIAAGWAYSIKRIEDFMRSEAKVYCKTIKELENVLFYDSNDNKNCIK